MQRARRLWPGCAVIIVSILPLHAQTEVVLHRFVSEPGGGSPQSNVIMDSAGNLYGTTPEGGTSDAGVVYKLSASGKQTVLHTFTGGADGGRPLAGVILDTAGDVYGTTTAGGASGQGIVFELSPTGQETVIYNFTGGADGGQPYSGVIRDSAGNLYGTTWAGGAASQGVVFKLDAAGKETVLHAFAGYPSDGAQPKAGLIRDPAGNLYGTTTLGGTTDEGTVFELDAKGQQKMLYTFSWGGWAPSSGVVRDSAGALYGTTQNGGEGNSGVVYKLDSSGQETDLFTFDNGTGGGDPTGGVVLDSAGNLYGTTYSGGPNGPYGAGVVFKLDPQGNETVLCGFTNGLGGGWPAASLIRDEAGNLYGTTTEGGSKHAGVVYKVDTGGQETVLYNFGGGPDGSGPVAGVILDSAGTLYGTTVGGGPGNAGVIYSLEPAGHEQILYSFSGGADGGNPYAGLIRDAAGNFYGTTASGGTNNAGVVFELDTTGHETVLYSFTGAADGGTPMASVVRDSDGNLYGTTYVGGSAGAGVVFKLDTTGHETVLHSFTNGADGGYPQAGVILDATGNLYGVTLYGNPGAVIFKLSPSGHETVLYTLPTASSAGGLTRDAAGNFYGALAGDGTVYKLSPNGQYSVLYSFTGGADGEDPMAGVILDAAGNLYGTTFLGGSAGVGTVYKVDPSGHETVLYSFTGGLDGEWPTASVFDGAGNLYGTTSSGGGKAYGGVVFKIKIP